MDSSITLYLLLEMHLFFWENPTIDESFQLFVAYDLICNSIQHIVIVAKHNDFKNFEVPNIVYMVQFKLTMRQVVRNPYDDVSQFDILYWNRLLNEIFFKRWCVDHIKLGGSTLMQWHCLPLKWPPGEGAMTCRRSVFLINCSLYQDSRHECIHGTRK